MGFGHEKLDVYRAAIEYVGWAYCYCQVLIVAMLTKLGRRGYAVHEDPGDYRLSGNDSDSDSDPDTDGNREPGDSQPGAASDAAKPRR